MSDWRTDLHDERFPERRPSLRTASRDQRHQTGRRGSDYPVSLGELQTKFGDLIEVRDGHWIWTGRINNKGYGSATAKFAADPTRTHQERPVHAIVWELLIGPVPFGMELDHLCDFTECVNPWCLEEVTHAENMRRIGDRQTVCRRAGHPRTPENVYADPQGRTRCRPCARERDRQPERLARSAERRRLAYAKRKQETA